MNKKERHDVILRLIASEPISRQDILAKKLGQKGFSVTQASISRDLEELGIMKVEGIYVRSRPERTVDIAVRTISAAGPNLMVLKCDPGMASAAAVRIDAAESSEIIGTVAGDDTIFVAVGSHEAQTAVIEQIRAIFGGYR